MMHSVETNSSDFILMAFNRYSLDKRELDWLSRQLVNDETVDTRFIINLVNGLDSPELQSYFYDTLVKNSYQQFNGLLLQELQKIGQRAPFDFKKVSKAWA